MVTVAELQGNQPRSVGRVARAFDLVDAQGRTHRLEDYAGRWLLLVLHRHLA